MPGVLQGRESFEGLRLEMQPSWLDIRSGKNISIEVSSTCAAVNYLSRSVVDAAQEIRHRQHSSLVARRRHLVTTLIVTLRPASSDRRSLAAVIFAATQRPPPSRRSQRVGEHFFEPTFLYAHMPSNRYTHPPRRPFATTSQRLSPRSSWHNPYAVPTARSLQCWCTTAR